MATTKTYTLVNGQPADATQVNKNFDDLLAGINAGVSATDKVLGRATAGAGPVEEIPCTAAGRAILDDTSAAAQLLTLGVTATAALLNQPWQTLLTPTEMGYVSGVTSAIQMQLGGKVGTGDARLSDARPANDVYPWAKSPTKPAYTKAEVGITTGTVTTNNGAVTVVSHGLGTTPTYVGVSSSDGTSYWVPEKTSTTFTIGARPVASPVSWIAVA